MPLRKVRLLFPWLLVAVLFSLLFGSCSSQIISFSQLIEQAAQYSGRTVTLEAFYYSGIEISALSASLTDDPAAGGRVVPAGVLIWVEGGITQELFKGLQSQNATPSGYPAHFGKLKCSGQFETGGRYGHLDAYSYQITLTTAEILNWSPLQLSAVTSPGPILEAPDDIINTPGGTAYRANVHQQGVQNPWPTIVTAEKQMTAGADTITVRYRNKITSPAGETRRNIINIRINNGRFENGGQPPLNLVVSGNPSGMPVWLQAAAGLPGTLAALLVLEISPDLPPGQYELNIGLNISGVSFGSLPCTVTVTR